MNYAVINSWRRPVVAALTVAGIGVMMLASVAEGAEAQPQRPNILWITAEDMGANLGCYGDSYATTPNLDRLASESVRYTNAFATAPVCSPARSCLITGVYATSLGTHGLRSAFPIPEQMRGFPAYLRAVGYYCTNNVKTDYNTANEPAIIRESWDESSAKAHWRNRRPGQPFFAVFNDMVTHQSRTSVWPYEQFQKELQSQLTPHERHDPAQAPVPPYWPDTPVTRRTIARYYDCITLMDRNAGRLLAELEEAGVADDTIVFFYADHGAGHPRHKRLVLDSGLHVPLIVRFPEKYRHLAPAAPGEAVDRLVSFVDFPATVLSLLGLPVPEYMQGRAFLGAAETAPRQYVYGARDRVDEAFDMARSVRDKQYLYVRNYMPHLSYNQPEGFSDQAEVRREITRLAAEGKLNDVQMAYAGRARPREELYDTLADPHQIRNLATSPEHKDVLDRMRREHTRWVLETHDLGFMPEAESWRQSAGTTPYAMARQPGVLPLPRIMAAARQVGNPDAQARQVDLLADDDAAIRYWAAVGLRAQGAAGAGAREALVAALGDRSPTVRVEAAGVLVSLDGTADALDVLTAALASESDDVALHAARTLQLLGEQARPALPVMQAVLRAAKPPHRTPDFAMFLRFSLEPAVERLSEQE
ncbi:MAG: sulfatase-like hydrolase/transferase [Thermoguttaceae bacterium]|jgi:arylsulfatase A-like enzyme|nr:sulfatase-like hydrolase/transferase [Thermoguttaceae bacterium]